MMNLGDNIRTIKGIGEKKALLFEKLGVFNVYDLISFFPRRYEDRSTYKPIALTEDGENACISAVIATDPQLSRIRRGLELVRFRIADGSDIADVTYFNQSWLKNSLRKGDEYVFYGRVEVKGSRRSLVNPVFEKEGAGTGITGRIMPIYALTAGLNQKSVYTAVRQALDSCLDDIPELLPEDTVRRNRLPDARSSYAAIHFPESMEALENARRRLIFEELFVLSCALGRFKKENGKSAGQKLHVPDMSPFFAALPFRPTNAQHRAVAEATGDMTSGCAMNRLLQGDVGSGKTLVAAALAYLVCQNGSMTAFMAPTEILADQHYKTLSGMLGPLGVRIAKLTGSSKNKNEIKRQLAAGEIDLIVGTHALFSDDMEYRKLALVITDEQHRFGVAQRTALAGKGKRPHVLVMSATPIPRTLALIIYGDLDVSVLDELPPGRQKVDTFAVDSSYRQRLNAFIRKQCSQGHKVFVVCPAVEENPENNLHLMSAEEHAKELQAILPELKVACVHGRMKAAEKDAVMSGFAYGDTDVLVSTTVIEVGVDVPEATLMIIENAERFGLSQLHQLRGRVGRGSAKSYCVLLSDNESEDVKARLKIMCDTNDGFKISEEDLRLRGPGDFFGNRQHGLPEMHVANLGADTNVMKKAQEEAEALLSRDPGLDTVPALKERIELLYRQKTLL